MPIRQAHDLRDLRSRVYRGAATRLRRVADLCIVRPMRFLVVVGLVAVLCSCSTIRVDGVPVVGYFAYSVPIADLRTALALARSCNPGAKYPPQRIEVLNLSEIHVHYQAPGHSFREYTIIKKIDSRWDCQGSVID